MTGDEAVLELKKWVKQKHFADKPWLVFGKGPTFSRRNEFDLTQFNKLALNHAVREQKVEIAHIIDIDVVEACADTLLTNCDWLIMPRVPNVKCGPGEFLTLSDWCACLPVLQELNHGGRLVTYDFAHLDSGDPWTVVAEFFSSEAALGILGRMGAKKIHSLGIDGGTSYSQAFQDLGRQTLLSNGQQSFDRQFGKLKEIAEHFQIDFQPLIKIEGIAGDAARTARATQAKSPPRDPVQKTASTPAAAPVLSGDLTLPAKIQMMEQEIRDLRQQLRSSNEELQNTREELRIGSERLGWARDEIAEYRERVLGLERSFHTLYKSKTWKLGRVFTKPAEALKKRLHKS